MDSWNKAQGFLVSLSGACGLDKIVIKIGHSSFIPTTLQILFDATPAPFVFFFPFVLTAANAQSVFSDTCLSRLNVARDCRAIEPGRERSLTVCNDDLT